jgi:hypothetical protein
MNRLHSDIIKCIFKFLDSCSIYICRFVCKRFYFMLPWKQIQTKPHLRRLGWKRRNKFLLTIEQSAAHRGYLNVLEYFYTIDKRIGKFAAYAREILKIRHISERYKHFIYFSDERREIIKWCDAKIYSIKLINQAAMNGNLELLKLAYGYKFNRKTVAMSAVSAAKVGNVNTIKYIFNLAHLYINQFIKNRIFDTAVKHQQIQVIRYLDTLYCNVKKFSTSIRLNSLLPRTFLVLVHPVVYSIVILSNDTFCPVINDDGEVKIVIGDKNIDYFAPMKRHNLTVKRIKHECVDVSSILDKAPSNYLKNVTMVRGNIYIAPLDKVGNTELVQQCPIYLEVEKLTRGFTQGNAYIIASISVAV